MQVQKLRKLGGGLAEISRWQIEDEQHLPRDGALIQRFLPQPQALDDILYRPSLDERLPNMLEPDGVDKDLLDPSTLTATRLGALRVFKEASLDANDDARVALEGVAQILTQEVKLDHEIRAALAALFKG
ncbi:MAG: hypothetical protein AAFN76_09810 [Pseudomonadota bacterium]